MIGKPKRYKLGRLAAHARRLAMFSMGMATMHVLAGLFNLYVIAQLPLQVISFYVPMLLMIVINGMVLYGNWQGMRRPRRGALASLLGALGVIGMTVSLFLLFDVRSAGAGSGFSLALVLTTPYALLYLLVAALQWRVDWLARRAADGALTNKSAALDTAHLEAMDLAPPEAEAADATAWASRQGYARR